MSLAPGNDGPRDRDMTPLPPVSLDRTARISSVEEFVTVPAPWLDRLLSLGMELPFDHGEEDVMRAIVSALELMAPEIRVSIQLAVHVTGHLTGHGPPAPRDGKPRRVVWTEPPKSDERVRSPRVFPEAAYERSLALPGTSSNGAIHFASDEDVLRSETSPHVQLMDRAAIVVAQALERLQAEERTVTLLGELRTVEAQIVQAEKLASLGQIAAGMVHELNNPLTSIAAYTDFLTRRAIARDGPDADDVERLRRIAESANRMLRFTRDLVSYARPSGDVPIAVELNSVVERALAFCDHEIADVGVDLERTLAQDVGVMRGLPDQLAQVFVNLVTNACHAMAVPTDESGQPLAVPPDSARRKPVLVVSTAKAVDDTCGGPCVMVVVQDNGSGISKENLDLIFQPFFTTKRAGHGTGLGLSIVKNIVLAHGGQIRAESDPSFGTRFIVTFPTETVTT